MLRGARVCIYRCLYTHTRTLAPEQSPLHQSIQGLHTYIRYIYIYIKIYMHTYIIYAYIYICIKYKYIRMYEL